MDSILLYYIVLESLPLSPDIEKMGQDVSVSEDRDPIVHPTAQLIKISSDKEKPVIICDSDLNLLHVNRAFYEATEYRKKDLQKATAVDLFTADIDSLIISLRSRRKIYAPATFKRISGKASCLLSIKAYRVDSGVAYVVKVKAVLEPSEPGSLANEFTTCLFLAVSLFYEDKSNLAIQLLENFGEKMNASFQSSEIEKDEIRTQMARLSKESDENIGNLKSQLESNLSALEEHGERKRKALIESKKNSRSIKKIAQAIQTITESFNELQKEMRNVSLNGFKRSNTNSRIDLAHSDTSIGRNETRDSDSTDFSSTDDELLEAKQP